jgi:hypothetical protein
MWISHINNSCTYEPLLKVTLQHRFHVKPLLLLGPLCRHCYPRAGTSLMPPPPFWDSFDAVATTRPLWGAPGTVVCWATGSFMSAFTRAAIFGHRSPPASSPQAPHQRPAPLHPLPHRHQPPTGLRRRGEPFPVSFHFSWPCPASQGCSSPPPPTSPRCRKPEPAGPPPALPWARWPRAPLFRHWPYMKLTWIICYLFSFQSWRKSWQHAYVTKYFSILRYMLDSLIDALIGLVILDSMHMLLFYGNILHSWLLKASLY